MKKESGFTLIELLAVIVVLAIIALITVPQILGMTGSSKTKSAFVSVQNYVDSVNKQNALTLAEKGYELLGNKEVYETGFDDYELSEIKIKGTKPSYVHFEYDKYKKDIKNGKFCVNGISVDYVNGEAKESEEDYCSKELVAGLYDKDNNLLYSWETLVNDYGLDMEWTTRGDKSHFYDEEVGKWYYEEYSPYRKVYVSLDDITSGAPKYVFAKNDFGDNIRLVLPSELGMITQSLFSGMKKEMEIIIPAGITRIQESAFNGSNITAISIGPDVTAIDAYSFDNTKKLKRIIIPDNVILLGSHIYASGDWADEVLSSSGVEEIKIGKGVTKIPHAFCSFCKNLKSIEIPSNVKIIDDYAFEAAGLQTLILHEGLETINQGAFLYTKINSVTLPNSLKTIGKWNFSDVPLTKLTIGTGLTEIPEYSFQRTKLTQVIIPSNVKKIGECAFMAIPATKVDLGSVEELGNYAFSNGGFESITIPSTVKKLGKSAFGGSHMGGEPKLKEVIFENPNNWAKEGTCTALSLSNPTTNAQTYNGDGNYYVMIHYNNMSECK